MVAVRVTQLCQPPVAVIGNWASTGPVERAGAQLDGAGADGGGDPRGDRQGAGGAEVDAVEPQPVAVGKVGGVLAAAGVGGRLELNAGLRGVGLGLHDGGGRFRGCRGDNRAGAGQGEDESAGEQGTGVGSIGSGDRGRCC